MKKNYDVVFDIDWQGTKQLTKYKELNLIKIFILPPDKKELKKRLINRNQDNQKIVEKRFFNMKVTYSIGLIMIIL